jgi:hypothetical protein
LVFERTQIHAVFHSTEASTMANKVVGMLTKSIPRLKVDATKPPKSVTTRRPDSPVGFAVG